LAEPDSAVGSAIPYTVWHWERLTLFLRQACVPFGNNLCEQVLQKAIVLRNHALFYKTQNGARVGDLFMSLFYTCRLEEATRFDGLTELQRRLDRVAARPEMWMPWNYRATLM
jgi:hypothetical protein